MKIAFLATVPPAVVEPGKIAPVRTVLVAITEPDGTRHEKTYDGNGVTDQYTRGVPVGSSGIVTAYFVDAAGNKSKELDPGVPFENASDQTPPSAPGALTLGAGEEVGDD